MPLAIQIQRDIGRQDAGVVTVKLTGNLDSETAPALERELVPLLNGTVKNMVFDLAGLKYISSAGLRVFAATRHALKDREGQAAIINAQPQIQEVFSIIKALPSMPIFRDVAELDRYLATRQRAHASKSQPNQ